MTTAEDSNLEKKTDAELDTIIDSHSPISPHRKSALEERYRRQRGKDEKTQRTQDSIRFMTKVILWLTGIILFVAIATLVGTLTK